MGTGIHLDVPAWLAEMEPPTSADDATWMRYALSLAWRNVREKTGGPFAAVIVDVDSNSLVASGVNLVQTLRSSVLHAEIVAIVRASEIVQHWNIGVGRNATMYSTAEPCAMCMGAIPWSGITRLVVAARDEDVRNIGFDEGAKPTQWIDAYKSRGIDVVLDVERDGARDVLEYYKKHGGEVY